MYRVELKKILIIGPTYIYGGVGNLMFGLIKYMDKERLHFDFLDYQAATDEEKDKIHEMGGEFFHCPRYSRHPFKFLKYIFNFYKNHKYDVVHCNNSTAMLFMYTLPLWFNKVTKIISHSHSSIVSGKRDKIVHSILRFIILRRANRFIACSEIAAEHMFGSKNSEASNYLLLKNGISPEKFAYNEATRLKMRESLGLENKYVIGHVGRFSREKNHSFMLDVFRLIADESPDAVLLFVGAGGHEDEARGHVKRLGLHDRVIFYGATPNVHELLQAMDVFFFPSLFEGLPIAPIEAQAAGLPVVASAEISKGVVITADFYFMDLYNDTKEAWAERLCSFRGFERKDTSAEIREAGYDLAESARVLEGVYLGL
ncbi:MAG: glycosyltransferase [Defluviitaleaceae bacterium]|nr:glycosyltransferase [Defluviitaleaceae bacterium]